MASPVRAGADLRLLRAAVFTAVCVALSSAGHTLASGHLVPAWTLAAGWLAVFAVVAPLAGRERSLPELAAGLLLGQAGLHAVFSAGQTRAAPGTGHTDDVVALAGRLLCGDHVRALTPRAAEQVVRAAGLDPSLTAAGHGSGGVHTAMAYSLPMLLGHLLAALAAGWLLRHGEAALWRLIRLSARGALRTAFALVRVLVAGTVPDPLTGPRPRCSRDGDEPPRTAALRHSLARRGPPAYRLAA